MCACFISVSYAHSPLIFCRWARLLSLIHPFWSRYRHIVDVAGTLSVHNTRTHCHCILWYTFCILAPQWTPKYVIHLKVCVRVCTRWYFSWDIFSIYLFIYFSFFFWSFVELVLLFFGSLSLSISLSFKWTASMEKHKTKDKRQKEWENPKSNSIAVKTKNQAQIKTEKNA